MKITKSQIKQIIKEELESEHLLRENVNIASAMAMHMLHGITRSGGARKSAIALVRSIFQQLGGEEATATLQAAIDAKPEGWIEK